jgi:signal recognition particle GTPase
MKTTRNSQAGKATAAKARYIMIGGFLGAGKTTAVGKLAKRLVDQDVRVGLITNDQGRNLVDTTLDHLEHFRPGKPTPTHRMEKLTA